MSDPDKRFRVRTIPFGDHTGACGGLHGGREAGRPFDGGKGDRR